MASLRKAAECLLSVFMVCCVWISGKQNLEDQQLREDPWLYGTMDESGAFQIYTAKDLKWFCFYVRAGYEDLDGILQEDIDLEGKKYCVQSYSGYFDGNGHTISGSASELFIMLEAGARVENLKMSDVNKVSEKYGASGIVWRNFGEIINCEVSGYIEGVGYTGGIASVNYGLIENCVNRANVVSTGDSKTYGYGKQEDGCGAGGIAGLCGTCKWEDCQTEVKITGCNNYGNVTAKELAGGICARLEDRTNEAAPNNSVQEMVEIDGFSLEDDTESRIDIEKRTHDSLSDCKNYGEVKVEQMVGADGGYTNVAGICGDLYWGDIYHCANLGKVAISETASRESESGWIYSNRPMAITYNMGFAQSANRHIVDCISLQGTVSNTMRHENVMEVSEEEFSLWEEGKQEYLSNSWKFDLEDAVYTCSLEPLNAGEEDISKGKSNCYLCKEFALCLPEYCEITEQNTGGDCYALKICFTGEGADEDGAGRYISRGDEAWLLRKGADLEEALTEIHESNTFDTWRVASFAENIFNTIPNFHLLKIDSLSLPGHKCYEEVVAPNKRIYLRSAIPFGSQREYMGEGDHILGNVLDILMEGNYEDGLYAQWIFVFTNKENNIRPSNAFIDLVEEGFYPLSGEEEWITIQKGESLWRLAEEYLGAGNGWKMLSDINCIEEPDMIKEGEVIRVPKKESWRKKPEAMEVQWLLQESE